MALMKLRLAICACFIPTAAAPIHPAPRETGIRHRIQAPPDSVDLGLVSGSEKRQKGVRGHFNALPQAQKAAVVETRPPTMME